MKREILMLASLGLLAGCAMQAPVAVAERGCREDACLAELDALRQKSKAELDACASENASLKQQARLESEACGTELYSRGQKAKADLEACSGELDTLRQKSGAELEACTAARAEAEKHVSDHADLIEQLEQRLLDQHREAESSRQTMLEQDDAIEQLEQRLMDQYRQAEDSRQVSLERQDVVADAEQRMQDLQKLNEGLGQALSQKEGELAGCQSNLSALQTSSRQDADALDALRGQLRARASATEQATARLKELETNLRQRLQDEIGAKNVEIEQLKDQLSVRVLDRILFRSGSAEILPRGRAVLDSVAAAIAGGEETIRIEGHTDSVPIGPTLKSKYFSNWELSTGRASSVARHFVDEHVIDPVRVEAVGFSKYRPVASNDTPEDRQRNRRVEIVLTPWKPMPRECPQ